MEKTILGEERYFDNTGMGCGRMGKSAFRRTGMAAKRDKLQDRNDRPWCCQAERFAG